MAQAAVAEPEIDQTLPPQNGDLEPESKGKHPGGRPKAPHTGKEAELAEEEFFELIASFQPGDWDKYTIYIWRTDPWFDNTNGGRDPKYIQKEMRAIDRQNLKEDYGSGTYRLDLIRSGLKNDRTVTRTYSTILDEKFPPALPPGDWLDLPKNKKWMAWRPLVEQRWADKTKNLGARATQPTDVESMIRLMERRNGGDSRDQLSAAFVGIIPKLLEQQNSAQDPNKVITALKEAKEFMTPPPAPPDPNSGLLGTLLQLVLKREPDPMLAMVMQQLTAAQAQVADLMKQLISNRVEQTKQPSPMEQVSQMAEIMTKVAGIIPQPNNLEPWQQVLVETVPKATDMVEKLVTMSAMRNRAPIPGQRPPVGQPITQAAPVGQPVVTAPPAQVNVGTPPPQTAPPQPATEAIPEMDIMTKTLFVAIADNAAAALKLGMPGDEFAERVCDNFGARTYDSFIEGNLKETLLPIFQSIPEAWQLLQPFEGLLPKFLEEFYAYANDEEDIGTTDAEPPKAAPPPTPKKPRSKKVAAGGEK